jgi:hypothetical protein
MNRSKIGLLATVMLIEVVGACAVYPPAQLVAARLSYANLSGGSAASLAPNALADAKKSLDLANREFDTHGDTSLCRDYSYIAQNRLDLADTAARAEEDRAAIARATRSSP